MLRFVASVKCGMIVIVPFPACPGERATNEMLAARFPEAAVPAAASATRATYRRDPPLSK